MIVVMLASRRALSSSASWATTSNRPAAAAASRARARAFSTSEGVAVDPLMGTTAPMRGEVRSVTFPDESSRCTEKQARSRSTPSPPPGEATSRNPSLCAPSRSPLNPLADSSSLSWPTVRCPKAVQSTLDRHQISRRGPSTGPRGPRARSATRVGRPSWLAAFVVRPEAMASTVSRMATRSLRSRCEAKCPISPTVSAP